jgi:hypothetical protein
MDKKFLMIHCNLITGQLYKLESSQIQNFAEIRVSVQSFCSEQ